MSKALVIKNADFSVNKITTITFDEEVPCTGVEFDDSAVSVSSLGDVSSVIGYTITPANTTDMVRLTSSNPDVVHVGNNNELEVVGIGTCTLTLECGTYNDTCAVTVDIYENPVYAVAMQYIKTASETGQAHDGIRLDGSTSTRMTTAAAFSDGNFSKSIYYTNRRFETGDITAIKIPANTTKIHIEAQNLYDSGDVLYFIDANESFSADDRIFIPILSSVDLTCVNVGGNKQINQDVTVPTGATGYILINRPNAAIDASITTEAALKTYAESTLHLSIHYLAS